MFPCLHLNVTQLMVYDLRLTPFSLLFFFNLQAGGPVPDKTDCTSRTAGLGHQSSQVIFVFTTNQQFQNTIHLHMWHILLWHILLGWDQERRVFFLLGRGRGVGGKLTQFTLPLTEEKVNDRHFCSKSLVMWICAIFDIYLSHVLKHMNECINMQYVLTFFILTLSPVFSNFVYESKV